MTLPHGFAQLKRTADGLVYIPESEWMRMAERIGQRAFDKGDLLVRAGGPAPDFFFIIKGLVRFFYCTDAGREFIKHFVMENGVAGSYQALARGEPCPFSIQALERTETLVIPVRELRESYDRHACWERLGRLNAEEVLLRKEERERELLLDPLEVRYLRFLEEYPGLADRVPQYHIASFLGVTDVALSRIRRKIGRAVPGK